MISIDGDRTRHNICRKYVNGRGSFDKIASNVKSFCNSNILTARITITDSNTDIDRYLNAILDMGLRRITYAVDSNISRKKFSSFVESLSSALDRYIKDISDEIYYELTNVSLAIEPLISCRGYRSHCNAGISYITKSADGQLYRCPRFIGDSNYTFKFDHDEVISKQDRMVTIKDNSENRTLLSCPSCVYINLCGGVCSFHARRIQAKLEYEKHFECAHRQVIFEKTLELMCTLNVKQRRAFLLYLNKLWQSST